MNVNWYVLIFGFVIGLIVVYLTFPATKIIIKYPTLDNINQTTYVDQNGKCYKYYAREISCT